jgi:hypothetical protein
MSTMSSQEANTSLPEGSLKFYLNLVPRSEQGNNRDKFCADPGAPFWWALCASNEALGLYFQAASREAAKARIVARYPSATFFR